MLNKELRPEKNSRRGEGIAWGLAAIVFLAIALIKWQLGKTPSAAWILGVLLLFSALSISLGNWVDRKTRISIDRTGIRFENGLRKVALRWHEITRVNVLPAPWGKKVQVIGKKAHFDFRTLGEIVYKGEPQARIGFAEGEALLKEIITQSGLKPTREEKNIKSYTRN